MCLRRAAIDSDYFARPSPWNAQRTFFQHRETEFNGKQQQARWLFVAREPHTRIKNILQHKRAQGADELLVRRKQPAKWLGVCNYFIRNWQLYYWTFDCVRARGTGILYSMCVSVSAEKLRQSQHVRGDRVLPK